MALDDPNDNGSFYDFGDEDLENVADLTILPDDTEAKLQLDSVTVGESDKGNQYWQARLTIVGEPDAPQVRHLMMLGGNDERQINNRKRRRKYFCQAFGISMSGSVDFSKYYGRQAVGILGVEEDTGYGASNNVKRWVTGA